MQSIDSQVIAQLNHWLGAGERCWLCTIVTTSGSSPRPVGSLLACNTRGIIVGSLSGGCVEDDLLERIWSGELASELPRLIEYGSSAEENQRLGLPCGGRLEVLAEPLQATPQQVEAFARLHRAMRQRRCVRRTLNIETGELTLQDSDGFEPLSYRPPCLSQSFGPRMRMLLVGAGALAIALSELALAMDYEVIVTDPRAEIREQWAGPELELKGGMPDDVVRAFASDRNSLVITLTHDPRIDDMALMEALTTDAWYIGALGSAKTTAKRRQRLRQLGITDSQLARLHAPLGLPIGSKTPVEIAVATMAEITRLRRNS